MEAPRPEQEIRGEYPAPAWDAVAAECDRSLDSPLPHQIRDNDDLAPAPAAAVVAAGGGGGVLGALQQLIDHAAGARGGGLGASLQQLFEIIDPRLQAARFFLTWGCCMLIYGLVLNPSANPDHIFLGFVFFTIIGTGLALLTLAGAGLARTAARAERFLRGFFF